MKNACGCRLEAPEPMLAARAAGRTFRFSFVYGSSPNYRWKGFTRDQSLTLMRQAMAAMSSVSGAKFVESNASPHVRMYFTAVPYNALGAYMGSGKIYFSQTRQVNEQIIHTCVQHEVGHYLGLKAIPAADKWGHCTNRKCHMHIDAAGVEWCGKCKSQLIQRYGA